MSAPIAVAYALAIVGALCVLPILWSLRCLFVERRNVRSWSAKGGAGVAQATFQRLQSVAGRGEDADVPSLADLGANQALPPALQISRFIAQAAVYLGLGGALFGLQQAVSRIGNPTVKTMAEIEAFVAKAGAVLTDFGGAFWSALAGVAVTVVLNAFISLADHRKDSLADELEDAIRDRMLPEAGTKQRVDPAFEALRQVAERLAALFTTAHPALEATVRRLEATAGAINGTLTAGTASLAAVRDEFAAAHKGLALTLAQGAQEIERAAVRVASALGTAAENAGSQIASSAREGAEAIRMEVESARITRDSLLSGAYEMSDALREIRKQLDQMQTVVESVGDIHEAIKATERELAFSADAHRIFADGVRADLVLANQPLLSELSGQSEEMSTSFRDLRQALKSHRDFVTQLTDTVAQIPDSVTETRVMATIQTAFAPLQSTLKEQGGQVVDLKEVLQDLEKELRAIRASDASDGANLLKRIDGLEQKIQTLAGYQGDSSVGAQLTALTQALNTMRDRVDAPVWRRILRKR